MDIRNTKFIWIQSGVWLVCWALLSVGCGGSLPAASVSGIWAAADWGKILILNQDNSCIYFSKIQTDGIPSRFQYEAEIGQFSVSSKGSVSLKVKSGVLELRSQGNESSYNELIIDGTTEQLLLRKQGTGSFGLEENGEFRFSGKGMDPIVMQYSSSEDLGIRGLDLKSEDRPDLRLVSMEKDGVNHAFLYSIDARRGFLSMVMLKEESDGVKSISIYDPHPVGDVSELPPSEMTFSISNVGAISSVTEIVE